MYVAGKYDDVWDADDLIVETISEITNFGYSRWSSGNTGKRVILVAYIYIT